jgi:hypothetical protein
MGGIHFMKVAGLVHLAQHSVKLNPKLLGFKKKKLSIQKPEVLLKKVQKGHSYGFLSVQKCLGKYQMKNLLTELPTFLWPERSVNEDCCQSEN